MFATLQCPHCHRSLKASGSLDGKEVKCPGCKKLLKIRLPRTSDSATRSTPPPRLPPLSDDDQDAKKTPGPTLAGASRFFSLPWLILVLIFGFLPWSEVSCSAKDFHWRVGQSGYQALYGGISSPFDSLETAKDIAFKEASTNKRELSKRIETERSD